MIEDGGQMSLLAALTHHSREDTAGVIEGNEFVTFAGPTTYLVGVLLPPGRKPGPKTEDR